MEIKTAIILAGGFGTRLQTVVSDVPKPMAPINGIPYFDANYSAYYFETILCSDKSFLLPIRKKLM